MRPSPENAAEIYPRDGPVQRPNLERDGPCPFCFLAPNQRRAQQVGQQTPEKMTNISSRCESARRGRAAAGIRNDDGEKRDGFARAERILMTGAGGAAKTPTCAPIDFHPAN